MDYTILQRLFLGVLHGFGFLCVLGFVGLIVFWVLCFCVFCLSFDVLGFSVLRLI